jgi:hypothetical protein
MPGCQSSHLGAKLKTGLGLFTHFKVYVIFDEAEGFVSNLGHLKVVRCSGKKDKKIYEKDIFELRQT